MSPRARPWATGPSLSISPKRPVSFRNFCALFRTKGSPIIAAAAAFGHFEVVVSTRHVANVTCTCMLIDTDTDKRSVGHRVRTHWS